MTEGESRKHMGLVHPMVVTSRPGKPTSIRVAPQMLRIFR